MFSQKLGIEETRVNKNNVPGWEKTDNKAIIFQNDKAKLKVLCVKRWLLYYCITILTK